MAEVRARGVEANKRKRELKAAQKEERKQTDAQNLSKTHSHVAALIKDLNELADEGPKQAPEVDKHGKPVRPYFSAAHREGDMDCFGDLKYLTRNDIKKAMKFSEDDLGVGVALHVDPKLLVDGSKLLRGRRKSGV